MRFASSFSTNANLQAALDEACGAVVDEIDASIDLVFVFFSAEFINQSDRTSLDDFANQLVERLGTENIIGCSAESVIANQYELQWQPAVSIWAASVDGLNVDCCHLLYQQMSGDAGFLGWKESMLGEWPAESSIFMLTEPFSFPSDVFLQRMNEDRAGVPVIGGVASGASQPGEARLILGKNVYDQGAALVRLNGGMEIQPVVSQGCRPIGKPFVITKAERNEIHELGGQPALDQLQAIFRQLPTREKQMVNQGLHIGRVVSEYIDKPGQGDFLIRNVVQIVEETGTVAIADFVRPGQTVQFQIRDHQTAAAELKQLLSQSVSGSSSQFEAGLMFNCNGRGTRMFPTPHHDAGLLQEIVGSIPVGGFFAGGEIGPIGNDNFLHGFTSSIALFRKPSDK